VETPVRSRACFSGEPGSPLPTPYLSVLNTPAGGGSCASSDAGHGPSGSAALQQHIAALSDRLHQLTQRWQLRVDGYEVPQAVAEAAAAAAAARAPDGCMPDSSSSMPGQRPASGLGAVARLSANTRPVLLVGPLTAAVAASKASSGAQGFGSGASGVRQQQVAPMRLSACETDGSGASSQTTAPGQLLCGDEEDASCSRDTCDHLPTAAPSTRQAGSAFATGSRDQGVRYLAESDSRQQGLDWVRKLPGSWSCSPAGGDQNAHDLSLSMTAAAAAQRHADSSTSEDA
jgi:hypothetical protein